MTKGLQKPVVVIGGGGHASILVDILLSQAREIKAVVCPNDLSQRAIFSGIPQLLADTEITRFATDEIELVNGIGLLPYSSLRGKINSYFLSMGYRFATVIADSAEVSKYATLEPGVQVFPQALIQSGSVIGAHSIVNSKALVEHDCQIGENNHIAPGAILCGQVTTERDVFIGAGATVLPNCLVGSESIIGAGALLQSSLREKSVLYPSIAETKPIDGQRKR